MARTSRTCGRSKGARGLFKPAITKVMTGRYLFTSSWLTNFTICGRLAKGERELRSDLPQRRHVLESRSNRHGKQSLSITHSDPDSIYSRSTHWYKKSQNGSRVCWRKTQGCHRRRRGHPHAQRPLRLPKAFESAWRSASMDARPGVRPSGGLGAQVTNRTQDTHTSYGPSLGGELQ